MEKNETKHYKGSISGGILLIGTGLLLPIITQEAWFNIIFMIRKAINTGDSGHLILASASVNFLYAVQSTFLFLGAVLVIYYTDFKLLFDKFELSIISFLAVIFLHILNSIINHLLWQPISTILALIIVLIIFEKLLEETNSILHVFIVSIQVFFAFQWLNIMQPFPSNGIDQSDIFCSIRIASQYLSADSVLNFTGSAFFLTFTFSAFITTTLFISYSQNINMMKENYEKEKEIQIMKAKALENRIYKEVNSLVHDLKTPLVTIRGLNSLLAISKDQRKFLEYSEHIDSSVEKMNEMISNFLYETSKKRIMTKDLINYIRAQLPLEDDSIKIDIKIEDNLSDICVNKIRMARAIINILENAILVPHKHAYKYIIFEVKPVENGINIIVEDNGIGIKESDISRIFEVGYSTNNTSGLGLPFAKQIIEDNKGTIDIASKPDEGTVVTIFLPSADRI